MSTETVRFTAIDFEIAADFLEDGDDLTRENITAIAGLLRHAAERVTWQPIDTAPKDGTKVQIFAREFGVKYWGCGYWFEGPDGSSGWIGSSFAAEPDGNWTTLLLPTHWLPLPDPPVPAADAPEAQ